VVMHSKIIFAVLDIMMPHFGVAVSLQGTGLAS